jgi:hypothetical protein
MANRKTHRLKRLRRTLKRKTRKTRKMKAGTGCENQPCLYSKDGKHKWGMERYRIYKCQNKNEKGEQCPCEVMDY